MKPNEFLDEIAALADSFRLKIELEVDAFATDESARLARVAKVKDPETGYRYFCETYFPHYLKTEPSRLHEGLYTDLPDIAPRKEGQKYLLIAPRGAAKSTHVSLLFPLWCIVTGKKHLICLIMDVVTQAQVQIEAMKAELEYNPRLGYDFPLAYGRGRMWQTGAIITKNNIKVEGFGTGMKIRGRRHGPHRPDLVILDDVENDENVESPKQRRKLQNWILKAVLKLGSSDGSMDVLYAGTVLHRDAVIVRFSKLPGWRTVRYRAIMKWPDRMDLWDIWEELYLNDPPAAEVYWEAHRDEMERGAEVNWPGMHTLLFLMTERAGDHDAFESEYQNQPINGDGTFRDITYWVAKRTDWIFFGALDPSLGKKNQGRDPSAILVGGYAPSDGVLDVVEASIRRRLPDVIIADALSLQRDYQCQMWFIESVQFQEFLRTEIMKRAAQAGLAMPCYPVIPLADKALRIERLQPPMKAGLVRLHKSQGTLIDQFSQWPTGEHDDGPDCLEMLWSHALQMGAGTLTGGHVAVASGADWMSGY